MLKSSSFRSKQYLEEVRNLPCVVCGQFGVDAHHIIGVGYGFGGTGTKAADWATFPLCRSHHTGLHNMGAKSWEALHGLQFVHALRTAGRIIENRENKL